MAKFAIIDIPDDRKRQFFWDIVAISGVQFGYWVPQSQDDWDPDVPHDAVIVRAYGDSGRWDNHNPNVPRVTFMDVDGYPSSSPVIQSSDVTFDLDGLGGRLDPADMIYTISDLNDYFGVG